MDLFTLLFIAIVLSFDSFAVSISCGLILKKDIKFIQAVRFSLLLAILQAIAPILGWISGSLISEFIKEIGHWIAFTLLTIIGVKIIIESRKENCEEGINPLNIWVNMGIGIATSIDALIVGICFALLKINIELAAFIIGSITFITAMLGLLFGKKAGAKFGKKMERLGGILLIIIGLKILIEHLYFS